MRSSLAKSLLILAAALVLGPGRATAGRSPELGTPAPEFDLPLLSGSGFIRSGDLFSAQPLTFLVFWNSGCPRCVESLAQCEAFYEEQNADSVAVVGIHIGGGDPAEVVALLGAHRILFPQLWDVDDGTGARYSVGAERFTVVLVDRRGRIASRGEHTEGEIRDLLSAMSTGARSRAGSLPDGEESTDDGRDEFLGIVFHGDARIRFLSIDTRGPNPLGPYGEPLEPGNTLLYRFDLDLSKRITRHLRIGGFVRIGNEDESVLETGPEYLGSPWGSAFAEISAAGFDLIAGYYESFMTPLTMMRWDWNDNPRIGGSAGCACGGAAGVLVAETLEELGPEIGFEGGTAGWRGSGFDVRAFYAIPRRAAEVTYADYLENGERARYSLEFGGVEALWRRPDTRTGGQWRFGARLARTWEDHRSVDFEELGYPDPDPFTTSQIVTADWRLPVVRNVGVEGEWVLWNETEQDAQACCDITNSQSGGGGIVGAAYEKPPLWKARFDYVRLEPGFYSPFAALSYEPNREGFRADAEAPIVGDDLSVSIFYKRLREIDPPSPSEKRADYQVVGVSADADHPSGVGGSVGWLEDRSRRDASGAPGTETTRRALVVEARYSFDKWCALRLEYERAWNEDAVGGERSESSADLYSLYVAARF